MATTEDINLAIDTRRRSGRQPVAERPGDGDYEDQNQGSGINPPTNPSAMARLKTPKPQACDLEFSVELRRIELLTSSMP